CTDVTERIRHGYGTDMSESTLRALNALGHFIKECKAGSCKQCSGKHNTLIHFDKPTSSQVTGNEDNSSGPVFTQSN
ncbi:hypothetical protein RF55_9683, partial [Lasius niger]